MQKNNLKPLLSWVAGSLMIFFGFWAIQVQADGHKAYTKKSATTANCPITGWAEGLAGLLDKTAKMPSSFSAMANDCDFNEWSWEAFVWATAKVGDVPRFLTMSFIKKNKQA